MAADGGSLLRALPCAFSPKSHEYLALCAQDGRLRIWDTDSKALHREYIPSAHLSATCTCISWGPCRTAKEGPQRKKRKSEAPQAAEKADLLALGTAAGSILIYSAMKGELHCTLDGGHSGQVNSVRWHPRDALLYSGSEDSYVAEWDLQTGKTRCKWKADRGPVSCVCVSPDGNLLLSAGQTIKMWDLETKEVYRRFTGHSTAVSTLCFATTRPPDSDGLYFLSGAASDRVLSVWQVRSDGKDKNAVLSFTLTEEPRHVHLAASDDKAVRVAVVCQDGQLHVFEHFLNGPCKKPLAPSCSVQVSSPGGRPGEDDTPLPVPMLAVAQCSGQQDLLLAYGNHLQPVVEKVTVNTAERHICLVRDVRTTLSLSIETAVSKVKTPIVNTSGKVLAPGLPGHRAPVKTARGETEKRKQGSGTKEMSIEERLGEIDLSTASGGQKGPKGAPSLQTDSYAVLLVQGLESKDATILNKVFLTKKDGLIKKTIARLPIPAVLPLVEELTKRIQGHPYTAVLMVRWLKAVLIQHMSYLSTLPDIVSQLGVLYHVIESRVKTFHKLTRLHGKLYLLMTQVAASDQVHTVKELDHRAKLVYEEESSEEEEASGDEGLRDEGLPDEDSDNWEEDEHMSETAERSEEEEEAAEEEMNVESKVNGDSDLDPENESEEE